MTSKPGRSAPSPRDREAQAARRERRLERQRQEAAARRRHARRRRARRIGFAALGFAALGFAAVAVAAVLLLRPDPEIDGVERPPNRGRGHIASPTYDTPTPTSGEHLAEAPTCTSYGEPIEPGLAVHALEHGAVIVWYQADRAADLRPALDDMAEEWDSHVLVAPNPDIESPIVAAAWNRLARYDVAGEQVRRFIDTYRKRGPERVPCDL